MADDMMELLEGDVLDVMDSDDDSIERYYDPDDELPEALREKMAAKEAREDEKESADPDEELAATVKASLEESKAAAKNATFDEDELAAAVRASIAEREAAEQAAFDQDELEAAMRESMQMVEANRANSCTISRLRPMAVEPPSEHERPSSLTGGYGLPPGLPAFSCLPPGLSQPPGLPSPPGFLPPGLGAPPGLPPPPGLPLPPCRISRDSGIAGDRSPAESEEKYGSEHGSNTQSESSADVNVDEEANEDEASTETCTVVDGTKDLDYATPFDDPPEQECAFVDGSKDYLSATPFADHSELVWAKPEVDGEGVYSLETMTSIRDVVEITGNIITLANYEYFDERVFHQLNKNNIQKDRRKTPRFADETPKEKEERRAKHEAAMAKAQEKKTKDQQKRAKKLIHTTEQNLKLTIPISKFSDVNQKKYEKRQQDGWSIADGKGGAVDDDRGYHYARIQFASERAEKAEASQWNEDGTREGSEQASQSGEERRGSMEEGSEGSSGQNTSSNSRRGSGSSRREDDRKGYSNEEGSDYRSEEKRDSQDSRSSRFSRPSNRGNDEESRDDWRLNDHQEIGEKEEEQENYGYEAQANLADDQKPCAFGNIHEVGAPATERSTDNYDETEPTPRSAFVSVGNRNEEVVRDRSDTFDSRGTEGTGAYGSADDRSFDARSPPEAGYSSRDRASTQASSRIDFDDMKDRNHRESEWEPRKDERKRDPVLERYNNANESESGQGLRSDNEERDHSRHEDSWSSNGSRDRTDSGRQMHSYSSQHSRSERGYRNDSHENWNTHGSPDRQRHESSSTQHSRSERGYHNDSRENWNPHDSHGRRDWNEDDRNDSYASQQSRSNFDDRYSRDEPRKEQKNAKKEVVYERFRESIGSGQGWGPGGGWQAYWTPETGDGDSHNNWNNRQSRDEDDWKRSRDAGNSWEERRDRETENHQNHSSRNDNRNNRTYRGSQHSDDGRRNSRDQYGTSNSSGNEYYQHDNREPARSSQRSQYGSELDNRQNSRSNDPAPDAFGNHLDAYPDAEQLESHINRRSPHSRNGDDDRERQWQVSLDSIPMDADRMARFGRDVGDSRTRHDSTRMSQASRGSGRANFDQRDSRDHRKDEYRRGSRDEASKMSQSWSNEHRDEHHHRDTDSSRQFSGSRDRVDDREAPRSYAGSNADHRERASNNNNSREWCDEKDQRDRRSRDAYDRRDDDRRSEASRYSDRGQRDSHDSHDSRDEYNTRHTDRHSQGSRSYAGSSVDQREHRDHRDSRDWNDTRDHQTQHSRTSDRREDHLRDSRDHHRGGSDYQRDHDDRASRSYAGSNYDQCEAKNGRRNNASIDDRAHERPREPSRASGRPDSDMARRESRASLSSRNSNRGDPLEQYSIRKARDEKEEMERAEREWKLRVVYEDQMLRARMRTKNDEPLCGYLAKEYGVEKPALRFPTRQPSESTTWVRGRTDFMAHVYYPDRDAAEAVEDEVIHSWYKEGSMHPSMLFSMKYGDWKAFHSQEAWLGEKEWVETPFHGQLDVRRRENEIDMDEFRFGEWTDEVLHIMQQHDKKMKFKQ